MSPLNLIKNPWGSIGLDKMYILMIEIVKYPESVDSLRMTCF